VKANPSMHIHCPGGPVMATGALDSVPDAGPGFFGDCVGVHSHGSDARSLSQTMSRIEWLGLECSTRVR